MYIFLKVFNTSVSSEVWNLKLRSLQKMQFALRYFNVYESSCSNQIMENSSRVFFNEKVILNF